MADHVVQLRAKAPLLSCRRLASTTSLCVGSRRDRLSCPHCGQGARHRAATGSSTSIARCASRAPTPAERIAPTARRYWRRKAASDDALKPAPVLRSRADLPVTVIPNASDGMLAQWSRIGPSSLGIGQMPATIESTRWCSDEFLVDEILAPPIRPHDRSSADDQSI